MMTLYAYAASRFCGGPEGDTFSDNPPVVSAEASLLAATKSALDELVWWAHATMAPRHVGTILLGGVHGFF
jgi:hypothetical protein